MATGRRPSLHDASARGRSDLTGTGSRHAPPSTMLVLAAGCLLVPLGALVVVGWYTRSLALVQVVPTMAPMQMNTALGFVGIGVALLASVLGRPSLAVAASLLVAALGALTVSEYASGLDLGIDRLLVEPWTTTLTTSPGRPSLITSTCFTLVGLALAVARLRPSPGWHAATGVMACLVGSVAALVLVGYVSGLVRSEAWSPFAVMAVHTAVGFLMTAVGVMAVIVGEDRASGAWIPVGFWLGGTLMAVALSVAMQRHETLVMRSDVSREAVRARDRIGDALSRRVQALVRMARRWEMENGTPYRRDAPGSAPAWGPGPAARRRPAARPGSAASSVPTRSSSSTIGCNLRPASTWSTVGRRRSAD